MGLKRVGLKRVGAHGVEPGMGRACDIPSPLPR